MAQVCKAALFNFAHFHMIAYLLVYKSEGQAFYTFLHYINLTSTIIPFYNSTSKSSSLNSFEGQATSEAQQATWEQGLGCFQIVWDGL